jgi:tRNA dimethylallyltransferase
MQPRKLITISGPTAIGKTSFSVALAKHLACPILSGDARQFYKEMEIGTAVPTIEEKQDVPHYFIQHKSIHEAYSVGDFEKDAIRLLNTLYRDHELVILVGGSNLYTNAVVHGLDAFPEVPDHVSTKWQKEFESKGLSFLQDALKRLDPAYFKSVDVQNHVRLLRALGVCTASGKPYSSFLGKPKKSRLFETISIELTMSREELYKRINTRVDIMIANGLVEEAKRLAPYKDLNALQTVGYRELFPYLEGKQSLEESVENIKKNTRRFAKRQLTWLRNHPVMHKLPYNTPIDNGLRDLLGI